MGSRALDALTRRPMVAGVIGAACLAFSPVFMRISGAEAVTAAFYRCAYAIPLLALLVAVERRGLGPLPRRTFRLAVVAGAFLAVDLVIWHHAIEAVGAGLASVLGNLQVLIVPLAAWALFGERPDRRIAMALPVVLLGVVLVSGVVGEGSYGEDPALGALLGALTSLAYTAFLLTLRRGTQHLRHVAGPLLPVTVSAMLVAVALGSLLGELELAPSWPTHGWLLALALSSQVVGWLFLSVALPRLPAALTGMLLLLQPVGSIAMGAVLLDERPSAAQLVGAAVVLSGVVVATRRRPAPPRVVAEPVPVAASS